MTPDRPSLEAENERLKEENARLKAQVITADRFRREDAAGHVADQIVTVQRMQAAEAALTQARAEVETARQEGIGIGRLSGDILVAEMRIRHEAALTQLRKKILPYAAHKNDCAARFCAECGGDRVDHMNYGSDKFVEQACTCGFDQLSEALPQTEGK